MKYVIWGAGQRGGRLFRQLQPADVMAFVDKSEEKAGASFYGKKVISLEEYAEQYRDSILVITHTFEETAVRELETMGIQSYMRLSDCPGELQEQDTRPFLKNYVKGLVNMHEVYGIWGCTVYGLEVYSWLSEIGNDHSYLIIEKNISPELLRIITENGYRFVLEDEVSPGHMDRILICRYREESARSPVFCGIAQTDLFDCSDVIEEYYNPEIEKLKHIHDGETCFIVATGPSLKIEDLNILEQKQIPTFSVNEVGYAYDSTPWRPTYYVGLDRGLLEGEFLQRVKPEEQCKVAFLGDTSPLYWEEKRGANVLKLHFCSEWPVDRYPKFSEDLARKAYGGGTIVYVCMQLAVYMGFKQIYLLGVDFTGANEHGSKYEHFFHEKELRSVSYTDLVRAGYIKARQYAETHGIKICNATRGGMLEVFERADFDSLF